MRAKPSVAAAVLVCLAGLGACDRPRPGHPVGLIEAGASQADHAREDEIITSLVKAALAADDEVDGANISVSTKYGHVTLRGTVPATRHIRRVEEVVRSIDGVRHVNNRLKPVGVLA